MVPTSFAAQPEIKGVYSGALREGLQLTLLHAALAAQSSDPDLVQVLIATPLQRQYIEIRADIEEIEWQPPADQPNNLQAFVAKIWTAESVDDFVERLPPAAVWRHADHDSEISLAVRLAAQAIRRASGCTDPKGRCLRFTIGQHFRDSLRKWEAIGYRAE
jgi:hypothetical protein